MPALENPKHERFAQELAKGKSQTEAYGLAGYSEDRGAACRLSANISVQERVAEIQERGAIRAEITVATLLAEAAEIQAAALEDGQHSAAVAALTAKAKLAGLWVDRTENENAHTNYVVSAEPVDDISAWEAEHSPKH